MGDCKQASIKLVDGAGEMAPQLRALAPLLDDQSSIPSTYVAARSFT